MSEKQRQANSLNGKHGGPKTQLGKDASKTNATRHGLTAQTIVLSVEDQSRFEAMLEAYTLELNPIGIEESDLVEEIVVGRWRQKRHWGIEASILELAMEEADEALEKKFATADPSTQIAFALVRQHGHIKALELNSLYES